jgi:transposase-like protein
LSFCVALHKGFWLQAFLISSENSPSLSRPIYRNNDALPSAEAMIQHTVKQFERSAPEFVEWLEGNIYEGLTCLKFPRRHRKKIRTSNGIERINREVKRRTRVAVLFPNDASALRLVTAVLIEIHEEWVSGRQYLDMEETKFHGQENLSRLIG